MKKIVAFVVLLHLEKENPSCDLTTELSKILPSYMIPSEFRYIAEIPHNPNAKADKTLLIEWFKKGIGKS